MATDLIFPVVDSAPWVNARDDEQAFKDFVESLGYVVAVEPDRLLISQDPSGEFIKPDLRVFSIAGVPLDPHGPRVYIELTSADRYTRIGDLSYITRAKNRLRAASGQEFINPSEYLRRKRRRLDAARRCNPDVVIVLLRYQRQLKVMADPKQLEDLLYGALHARPRRFLTLVA